MKKFLLTLSFGVSLIMGGIISCSHLSKQNRQQGRSTPGGDRYVVVLSLDGFRDDYQNMAQTPFLDAIDQEGLSGSFRPCFPSLTFPNHYAMATGLHPNNHGIISNEFWDDRGKRYRLGDRKAVEDPYFYQGEPLWNTAKQQGVHTASYFWVGSETAINGSQPDRWKRFDNSVPYKDRADSVLKWLNLPEPERPHLLMWYLEEPDHTGHHYSPEAPETVRMIEQVDSVVGYFRQGLKQLPHGEKVDFIIVSDHGMARFDKDRVINFADYLPIDSFVHISTGPFTQLYPKPSYTDTALSILKKIKGIKAYRKSELPKRLHFGTNPNIGEIVILPEIGVTTYFKPEGLKGAKMLAAGHGFDNAYPEMLALFKAVGPHFQAGRHITDPILNITLYPLVCQLLNINPAPHDADEELARSLIKQ